MNTTQEELPPLPSVGFMSSAEAVGRLLTLVNAQEPILDCTFGSGDFWIGSTRTAVGCDIDPDRARDSVQDFTNLSFKDGEFPTVVFDPPFHPYVGSIEETQFKGMGKNEKELRSLFDKGLKEAWRVTSRHLLVKCQGFVHNHKPQWMPLWAIEICGEPFEWLIVARNHKVISGRWKNVKSLRRNHADYLVFDKKGNHR
jgi:hypothetical protein